MNYIIKPMVQFDEQKKPCICGSTIVWLESIEIKAMTKKRAEKKAFEILNKKYPKYNKMIQLW